MTNFKKLVSSCALGVLAIAIAAPVAVVAQETTADIRGQIKGAGAPLAGASVVVTHIASGTRANARTDANGGFAVSGLRAGGPYRVDVDAANFLGATVSDVYLSVSEPFNMSLDLTRGQTAGSTVVVRGDRAGLVRGDGTTTALRRDAMEARVVINQDLRELARSSPLVSQNSVGDGGISIAGSNPRTNRITIDGVAAQDDFGLNTGGFPTRRGPISIDAISQYNISATPFDVKNGGFLGGALDIVLRSGDNDLHGAVFGKFKSEDLTGAWIDGTRIQPIIDNTNYGASLRGRLLRDRLFFALAYESFESSDITTRGPAGGGFANTIVGPTGAPMTQADIDAVTNVYKNTYSGTRNVGVIPSTKPVTDEKYSLRLDLNITDDHRANFTYRRATSEVFNFTNLGSTTAALDSQWYMTGEDDETMAFQVNSKWNDNLSTELRLSHRDYTRLQEPPGGQDFSDVTVCSTPTAEDTTGSTRMFNCANSAGTGRGVVRFGPDQFRHANYLTNVNDQVHFEVRYRAGAHSIKTGVQHQMRDVYNLFVANSDGTYYFDSIADFTAGRANRLIYTNAPSGNPDDAAAAFDYTITALYAQDNWQIADNLRVNFGLRYDTYGMDKKPVANANFLAREGFSNTNTYDGLSILMPRVSFNWEPMQDLKVSGGVGLFSGGLPDVFMSNSYSNTGIATVGMQIERQLDGTFIETGAAPGFTQLIGAAALNVGVNAQFGRQIPASVLGLLGGVTPNPTSEVNALANNFEVPSEWKANIAISKELPWGLRGTFDGVITRVNTGYAFRDGRATPLIVNGVQARTPDGRIRYDGLSSAQRTAIVGTTVNSTAAAIAAGAVTSSASISNRDIIMYNPTGDLGEAYVAAFGLSKRFGTLSTSIAYTYQNIEELGNSGRFSSTASSLYGGMFSGIDPNAPTYGRAQEEIRNAFKYSVDWKGTPFGDLETRLSLFGDKRNGRPITFVMNAGSGRNPTLGVNRGSNLAYIPNFAGLTDAILTATSGGVSTSTSGAILIGGDNKVAFDNITTLNNVRNLVNYFGLNQGEIANRSAYRNQDIHLVDMKLSQEIPSFFEGHKAIVSFEFANLLNMLNDEWGTTQEFFETQTLYNVICADATGAANNAGAVTCNTYRISNASTLLTAAPSRNVDRSRWQITVGLRYEF